MGRPVRPSKLVGESDESDSMCTEVWHDPSSSRQTDENRLVATSPAPGSRTRFQPKLKRRWPLCLALRPNSRTVAEATVALLVVAPLRWCPKALRAAEFTRNSFANPEGFALSPKTHGLSEDLAVVTSPKATSSTRPESVGVLLRRAACEPKSAGNPKIAWRKLVSPRKREVHAA